MLKTLNKKNSQTLKFKQEINTLETSLQKICVHLSIITFRRIN